MSSYGSAHSGQLHPGYQPQQQRARSYSNPPYPTTPGTAPYPQQQQAGYFAPQPAAPCHQAPPTSAPMAIPASNRKRASSDYGYGYGQGHGYGTSPSHPPPSSPYAHSFPTQHLQPIPQQQPIPENYQYPPQPPSVVPGSPTYHRRRSSSSQYGYNPRQSYESAHSYQSAHSQPSPDYYARPVQNVNAGYGDYHGDGGDVSHGQTHPSSGHAGTGYEEPPPPKDYGDWDKEEVSKYRKNKDLERRPTLGGSLMSLVGKLGGSRR